MDPNRGRRRRSLGLGAVFKLAAVPLAVLLLFLIYRYLPNRRRPLNRVLPAAIAVGLLMEALKYIIQCKLAEDQRHRILEDDVLTH